MPSGPATRRMGTGSPLVLIHGVAGSWRGWETVMPLLADRFDVLAPALAGHEDAGELPAGVELTVRSMTDAVEREMDAAGFGAADLVGNSLGGWIAFELAKRGRARSVLAFSPAGGWTAGDRAQRSVVKLIRQGHAINRWAAPRARSMMRRSVYRRLMYMRAMAHPERLDPEVAADAVLAFASSRALDFLEAHDARAGIRDLDRVTCPVLVAWPEKDRILPERRYSAPFREQLPRVETTTLEDVGHVPMWDDPGLVAGKIRRFADQHAERGAPRFRSGATRDSAGTTGG